MRPQDSEELREKYKEMSVSFVRTTLKFYFPYGHIKERPAEILHKVVIAGVEQGFDEYMRQIKRKKASKKNENTD